MNLNEFIVEFGKRKKPKPLIRPIKTYENGITCPDCGGGLKEKGRRDPMVEQPRKNLRAKKVMALEIHHYGHQIEVFCDLCDFRGHRPD